MTDEQKPKHLVDESWDVLRCGGHVGENGICAWCGADYTAELDSGQPRRCSRPWVDRPLADVRPKFRPVTIQQMKLDCPGCGATVLANSIEHEAIVARALTTETLNTICPRCGYGIRVRKLGGQVAVDPATLGSVQQALKRKMKG